MNAGKKFCSMFGIPSAFRERNADSLLPVSAADWQAGNHRSSSWVLVAFSPSYL